MRFFRPIFFVTISVFLSTPGFAQDARKSQNGFCLQEMNKELKNLGLGTFTSPAKGVERKANDSFVSFTREGGDLPPMVAISKLFNGSVQKLKVRLPTVLFGRYEEKELTFNESCEVTAIDMVADGTAAHFEASRCEAILKAYKASAARTGANNLIENSLRGEYPNHGWAKCENVFSSNLIELCKDYAPQFPKSAGGDRGNDGESIRPVNNDTAK